MVEEEELRVEPWMRGLLLLAGAYNLGWGFFIYNFPNSFYQWLSQSDLNAPAIISWQGIGVMLFGAVYIAVAIYPTRFWYLLALGIFSKIGGAAWFYFFVLEEKATKQYLFHLIMNDLVWVIPFVFILVRAYQVKSAKTTYEKFT
ncbi:hypothetical protein OKW21_005969 [Catalinimonas alkaloidigena]|uniref:hypothetical protein n=1 Tax=Catalinimonas alkaloidigena TaxID=1075417 RepID=UPI002405BFE5|nr:hypothetical protein [Catalinimonas alkaloidigena]MDF9800706.1 hypothetical protein [Catalinimonas alkaloidigena]